MSLMLTMVDNLDYLEVTAKFELLQKKKKGSKKDILINHELNHQFWRDKRSLNGGPECGSVLRLYNTAPPELLAWIIDHCYILTQHLYFTWHRLYSLWSTWGAGNSGQLCAEKCHVIRASQPVISVNPNEYFSESQGTGKKKSEKSDKIIYSARKQIRFIINI